MNDKPANIPQGAIVWLVFGVAVLIPLLFWLDRIGWSISKITAISLFPLLGIWAWSIMWTHYVLGTHRILYDRSKNILYSRISGLLVLVLILLHPTILAWNQWKITDTLPPTSYYNYAGNSLKLYVFMGLVGLILFLAYEVFERIKDKKIIRNNWFWISLSQAVAMVLIFMHALKLGNLTNDAFFQLYWILLGFALIPCIGVILQEDYRKK